ncbi:Wzy polymerase domain-containing protein [Marinobacter sp. C2H3]|uniref:Wzy polymerase domain-containing protein n=1 Tax=Marinobacter sp. C2H3 TaxID=3119003 RepID=UPI00300F412E
MRHFEPTLHLFLIATLVLVAFSVPFHYIPIGSFAEEFIAGYAAVLGAVVSWAFMPKRRMVSSAAVLWLVWGVVLTISFTVNEYSLRASGLWVLIYWFVGLASIVWFSRLSTLFSEQKLVTALAAIFAILLVLQALLGVAKFYGMLRVYGIDEAGSSRLPGLINQYNLTASAVMIGAISVIYLNIRGLVGTFFTGVLLYFAAVTEILTDTRSVILYIAVVLITLAMSWSNSRGDESVARKFKVLGLTITASVVLAFGSIGAIDSAMRYAGPTELARPGVDQAASTRDFSDLGIRLAEAKKIAAGIGDHAIFGVGPDNYSSYSYQWDDLITDGRHPGMLPTHSHNIFTMVFAEEGLLGLLVLAAAIIFTTYFVLKSPKTAEWFWKASLLGVIFVYSNVEYPLWYLQYLVVFLGVVSLVLPGLKFNLTSRSISVSTSVATLVVMFGLGYNLINGYWALIHAGGKDVWDAETIRDVRAWQSDSLLGPYAELLIYQRILPDEGAYDRDLERVDKMSHWRPHNLVQARKIELLVLKGESEKACKVATKAIRIFPSVYVKLKADLPLIHQYRQVDVSGVEECIERIYGKMHVNADIEAENVPGNS